MPMTSQDLLRQRQALQLSRSELARAAGTTEALVARIEADERQARDRPISMRLVEDALAKAGLSRPPPGGPSRVLG